MQYELVMKKAKKFYQPFDLDRLSRYDKENLTTLEGIDAFTSKYEDEMDLKNDLLEANYISVDELDNELKIIFYEKDNTREFEYGICYKNMNYFFDGDNIANFIYANQDDLLFLNKLYNKFKNREDRSQWWAPVLDVLKNYRKSNQKQNIYAIRNLPYVERRAIGSYIYHLNCDTMSMDRNDRDGIRKVRKSA